jgi:hypothetical protein
MSTKSTMKVLSKRKLRNITRDDEPMKKRKIEEVDIVQPDPVLPPEIIACIYSFIPNKDITTFKLVCKQFDAIGRDNDDPSCKRINCRNLIHYIKTNRTEHIYAILNKVSWMESLIKIEAKEYLSIVKDVIENSSFMDPYHKNAITKKLIDARSDIYDNSKFESLVKKNMYENSMFSLIAHVLLNTKVPTKICYRVFSTLTNPLLLVELIRHDVHMPVCTIDNVINALDPPNIHIFRYTLDRYLLTGDEPSKAEREKVLMRATLSHKEVILTSLLGSNFPLEKSDFVYLFEEACVIPLRNMFLILMADRRFTVGTAFVTNLISHTSELFIEFGQYFNYDYTTDGNTFLDSACSNNFASGVHMLIKTFGVDPSKNNQSALRKACSRRQNDIIEILLRDERVNPTVLNNEPLALLIHGNVNYGYSHSLVREIVKKYKIDQSTNLNILFLSCIKSPYSCEASILLKELYSKDNRISLLDRLYLFKHCIKRKAPELVMFVLNSEFIDMLSEMGKPWIGMFKEKITTQLSFVEPMRLAHDSDIRKLENLCVTFCAFLEADMPGDFIGDLTSQKPDWENDYENRFSEL